MKTIIEVLMERDGLTKEEADRIFNEGYDEFHRRLIEEPQENHYDFCQEWFGLEPDYLMELV